MQSWSSEAAARRPGIAVGPLPYKTPRLMSTCFPRTVAWNFCLVTADRREKYEK